MDWSRKKGEQRGRWPERATLGLRRLTYVLRKGLMSKVSCFYKQGGGETAMTAEAVISLNGNHEQGVN